MIDALARRLYDADRTATPTAPLPADLTIADAYAIQLAGRALRGRPLVGRKVGLTSAAMQEMLGVRQPDFGYLTDAMVSPSGAVVDAARFIAPRVEGEIAFRLARPLHGAVTIDDVLDATEAVAPALEVIDSRIADWRIAIADTIADNASSGHVVLGAWRPLAGLDLAGVELELIAGGERVAGRGDAVLGHPAAAVAWLARALAEHGGEAIAAGEIVIPGAMARALPIAAGDAVRARLTGLGEVTMTFEEGGGDG
jgi:2-keto-4-pentenoate hydratase